MDWPATPAEFQWFSGLGVKDRRGRPGVTRSRSSGNRLRSPAFPHDLDALWSFKSPADPSTASYRASIPWSSCAATTASSWTPPTSTVPWNWPTAGSLSSLADLPSHAILDRGRLVGLWDYDPASEIHRLLQLHPTEKGSGCRNQEYRGLCPHPARRRSFVQPRQPQIPPARLAALRQARDKGGLEAVLID